MQSLPFSKFAGRIVAAGKKNAGSSEKRETVNLGGLGGLGKLLGGD